MRSEPTTHAPPLRVSSARERGQSLVEFALILPILIILFVALADFARVFAAGVVIEGAARDAAEIAAQEYLSNPPGDTALPAGQRLATSAPGSGAEAYYDAIHVRAAAAACSEARGLPNVTWDAGTQTCSDWPAVLVCVHDGADPRCGSPPPGYSAGPAECAAMSSPALSNAQSGPLGNRWVEVRLCYQFVPILRLPIFSFGDVFLQRVRSFDIPCYFATGTPDACG